MAHCVFSVWLVCFCLILADPFVGVGDLYHSVVLPHFKAGSLVVGALFDLADLCGLSESGDRTFELKSG